jgi:hypothetical protein
MVASVPNGKVQAMAADGRTASARACPTRSEAEALARSLLWDHGTRWPHVRTAGFVAAGLAQLFDAEEVALLVAAATLHDIGYSTRIRQTGFHPLDGGLYLRSQGYPDRLAALVANHSWAVLTAPMHEIHDLCDQFPGEQSLLSDALVYADMHSAPRGGVISPELRLADIADRHHEAAQVARAELLRSSIRRVQEAIRRAPNAD